MGYLLRCKKSGSAGARPEKTFDLNGLGGYKTAYVRRF
ncbi:hypothetical protein A11S_1534 [Micavibrio aeruginosavorus EPB]|uniref:Uncharacterized protein n=1 Tax=Micavibrio aeruginosavorus EPB TaxID=349215 RepID=M4VIM5_9BACT|nr:hypothetical protein A11S_1534 [Micavibrio aeruginosavorus EPB]